ncbi:MAG: sn-glycerol-1-phosphate dehydrogenase [Clostridia bacterium]|nr:sn-glycerol-1-phosphate dehydrogenase [Clostridia bacterium]
MSHLIRTRLDCPCGKPHICPIRTVEIGEGVIRKLPGICEGYKRILLVADRNTHRVCGGEVAAVLGTAVETYHIFTEDGVVIPDENAVAAMEAHLTAETDLIVGVGSGVINDLCKYVSHRNHLPYVIVATAPSMDGYASAGAAMILDGMKVTPPASPPMAIVAVTRVVREAPMDMIRAGYGDIIGKYSCLNDWKLAAYIRGEYFCETVYSMVMNTADRIRDLAAPIGNRDGEAIAALMEALVEVGIAMAYVGSSRPASGSEHHLSHFFEITGILNGTPYLPHGTDVAYSSVITARLRREILQREPVRHPFDRTAYETAIRKAYTTIADSVIAQQDRLGWYQEPATDEFILTHVDGIRAILSEAPDEAETRRMVEAVGLRLEEMYETYGHPHIAEAIRYAKDLKDRYSVLWVYDLYYR